MAFAEHIKTSAGNSAAKRWRILATVTAAIGLAAGLGGMLLGLLLHFIQHIAYGYGLHAIVSRESFLEGVKASSTVRQLRHKWVLSPAGSVCRGLAAPSNGVRQFNSEWKALNKTERK